MIIIIFPKEMKTKRLIDIDVKIKVLIIFVRWVLITQRKRDEL